MWLLVALGLIVALAALVLAVPVDLSVRLKVYGRLSVEGSVSWLFGRAHREFRTPTRKSESTDIGSGPADKQREKRGRRPPGRKQLGLVLRIIHTRGLLCSLMRLARRVAHCVKLRTASADVRIGLDDPCDTAMLVGGLSLAASLADAYAPCPVRLTPAFGAGMVCDGEGALSVRFFPVCLVLPAVAFIFSPSTLRVLVILARWKLANK